MPTRIVPRWESMLYDGSNGDAICQFLTPPAEKISEEGGVLVYEVQGYQQPVNQGEYVLRSGASAAWGTVLTPQEYRDRYYELPEPTA